MAIKSKKKLVGNIIFYTLAALLYIFVIFELVSKFTGGNVYLFGYRFDVVLTDSMSEKNENHLDFLEGTSQIQAFDLVTSQKINDDTKLNVKDVVLFKNPDLNNETTMHRIVNIIEKGDEVTFVNVNLADFNNKKGIDLIDYGSCINCTAVDLTKMTLVFESPFAYSNFYSLQIGTAFEIPTSHSSIQLESGYYEHTMVYERTATYPVKLSIHRSLMQESYITSWSIECDKTKNFTVIPEDYVPTVEKSNYKFFNSYFLYETRGDKAKDSDGIFERNVLISRVTAVAPKLGYFVRFITSIPGIILIIGLAIIFTISAYFYNRVPKKKGSNNTEIIENDASKKDKKQKRKKEKQKDEKV